MGRSSKQKGKRGELDLKDRFTEAGFPMKRTGVAGQIRGDLDNDLGFYVECRRREKLSMPAWIREVAEKTPEGQLGVLAFRRSHEPWHVCLSLDHFIQLLKEARA